MPLPHLPTSPDAIACLRQPSEAHPWRVLVSGCMAGMATGWLGDDNQMGADEPLQRLLHHAHVQPVPMCPEHLAIGTPRGIPDIHRGDGFDVVEGRARVLVDGGLDVTAPLLGHARAMAALGETCDLAILLDMSATCGSQVISLGSRQIEDRLYQQGPGLVAALLWMQQTPFTSQRDERTLSLLQARLDGSSPPGDLLDHHQRPWTLDTFPEGPWSQSERALSRLGTRAPVYKILTRTQWHTRTEHVPRAPIDKQDGFLHLSTAGQLEQTLDLHFSGQQDLVILAIDPLQIPTLVWEPSRGGTLFPHAYGAVPIAAITRVEDRSTR